MNPAQRQRIAWFAWTILLVSSLVALRVLNSRATASAYEVTTGVADSRFGFRLEESAKALGVDFVHQGPTFDARLAHIMPQVAAMGAAVAVADFDRDGWQDFYVTNSGEGSLNRLYRNQGNGTFSDVATQMGVADVNQRGTGVSMGAVWGDYDNDGWDDLFLYRYGRPELFHNDKGVRFVAVGEQAGLPKWVNANSATWLDYDRDGRLDLFLAGYWADNVDLWKLETTKIMPESFEYATNGGRKYLLHNRGDGTFEDKAEELGIKSRRWTLALIAADLLGTGYPDLFLSNDYGVSELFANRGGKGFVDVAEDTGVGRIAEERDECVHRRCLQRRTTRDLQDEHLRAGRAGSGQRFVGAPQHKAQGPRPNAQRRGIRQPRFEHGHRLRRLELGRAVRRPEQRRHSGSVSRQRLRLGWRANQLLVRLRRHCRRAQPDHRRCRELAADEGSQPLGLSAEASVAQ